MQTYTLNRDSGFVNHQMHQQVLLPRPHFHPTKVMRTTPIMEDFSIESIKYRIAMKTVNEDLRGLSCGALDPEFDAEEGAAREMYSQSDL